MRIEDIREQLLSLYSRHDSLYLTKHRKSRSEYYYNFNNTYEINELLLLTDSISNQMTIPITMPKHTTLLMLSSVNAPIWFSMNS